MIRDADYQDQIKTLSNIQLSIESLSEFIEVQKTELKSQQLTLNNLQLEQESLRPLIEADREIVDAILAANRARDQSNIWIDRAISFMLGIVSSLVASLILSIFLRSLKHNKASQGTAKR